MADAKFEFIGNSYEDAETARPSLTYWQDAWRRLRKNHSSILGLVIVALILLFGLVGPLFTPYSYSDQVNKYKNLPPFLSLYELSGNFFYLSKDYNLFEVSPSGRLIDRLEADQERRDIVNKVFYYLYKGDSIRLDFMLKSRKGLDHDRELTFQGAVATKASRVRLNLLYPFGTDDLGRDLLTRVMYGARISLFVAFVATMVNLFIGMVYGSIAGFEGGRVDDVMMRIVDIINSVPLVLYVILLMVWFRG